MREHKLFDFLKKEYEIGSDRELAHLLGSHPAVISRVRSKSHKLSSDLILMIHEKTGMEVADIQKFLNE
jgi:DNA-binding transcriptional regulator YdaS (Cro superfamily)